MIDKIRLDNLLHAYRCSNYWLDKFSDTVNDRSKLFGPEWESTNRRYELANDQYTRLYYSCKEMETTIFHKVCGDFSNQWYKWYHQQSDKIKKKFSGKCRLPAPLTKWQFIPPNDQTKQRS